MKPSQRLLRVNKAISPYMDANQENVEEAVIDLMTDLMIMLPQPDENAEAVNYLQCLLDSAYIKHEKIFNG
jgi:hypothetical protein